jgi:hyperosmotically inducible periplasmic protein
MANKVVSNSTHGLHFYLVILAFSYPLFACQSLTQTVTADTLQTNVLDAAINVAVKSRILADPLTKSAEVSVETVRGQVYLSGVVPTAGDKRRAQELANQVPGALTVVNKLEVKGTQNL